MPKVAHLALDTLDYHPDNPRQGDVGAVIESLAVNGWFGTIVTWAGPNPWSPDGRATILAGEHRVKGLHSLQGEGWTTPAGVTRPYDELRSSVSLPPVGKVQAHVFAADELTEEQARRILLADNRTSDLATYDDAELAELLQRAAETDTLLGTGYDGDDLDVLLAVLGEGPTAGGVVDSKTPGERAGTYEASAIRSIILPYTTDNFEVVIEALDARLKEWNLDTHAEVVKRALTGE